MPRYRTVLFDLDGTLIDSIQLILNSFHHTFATFGLPARTDHEWLQGIGTPLTVQFAQWARDAATMDAMIATYRSYNLEHHDALVRAYPGVMPTVEALRAAGIQIGIVTSKLRQTAWRALRVAGLEGAIEAIVGADDVVNPKPHREPVDRAMALLGASAETTIFVGDSVHDMRSGEAAAVPTGAALWGPFGRADFEGTQPTHWLETPEQLVQLIMSL